VTPGPADLWFLPLGGCGEIGMNLNLFGHDGAWLMVDCGITFERAAGSGDTLVQMPDPAFIASRRDQLVGLVATHAHEDHIGAIPYLWPQLRCPIYTTAFTAAVLRSKVASRSTEAPGPVIELPPGAEQQLGPFHVRWLPITHSTPDTCALHITTPAGSVLHTADWKLDAEPVVGPAFDARIYQSVGQSGVEAVICDSTNAPVPGFTPTEAAVAVGLEGAIRGRKGRVVVACFASSIARLQTVARIAADTGRYLGLLGRSLHTMAGCARGVGLLDRTFASITPAHLGYLPREEVLVLATGSQGEPGAALQRLAGDSHPHLNLEPGDTVIFSARTIPGNEASVQRLQEAFRARGIEVVNADTHRGVIHASGHPCAGELDAMYRWLKAPVAVPVHGEARHMAANAEIARAAGVRLPLTGQNGDLFHLAPEPGIRRRAAATGRLELATDGSLQPVA
jgi:ribonuclease J